VLGGRSPTSGTRPWWSEHTPPCAAIWKQERKK
jgi:hypothetical protein